MSLRWFLRITAWVFIVLCCIHIHSNNVKSRRIAAEQKQADLIVEDFKKCILTQIKVAQMMENPYFQQEILWNAVKYCKKTTGYAGY